MLQIFDSLKEYLKERGFKKLLCKSIPHIYHLYPSEEDLYALFINNATLIKREVSSTIEMACKMPYSRNMRRNIKKVQDNKLSVKRSYDFSTFMLLKEEQLFKKYGLKPTHTALEMEYMEGKFTDNIKLVAAEQNETMIGRVVIYENKNVIHAQYQEANELGMDLHVPSLLFDNLINQYSEKKYFDFGISTENNGFYLNEVLIDFKERFGARSTVYDSYELNL